MKEQDCVPKGRITCEKPRAGGERRKTEVKVSPRWFVERDLGGGNGKRLVSIIAPEHHHQTSRTSPEEKFIGIRGGENPWASFGGLPGKVRLKAEANRLGPIMKNGKEKN